MMQEAVFADSVQAIAVHNGVVRLSLVRLDSSGKGVPALELLVPMSEAKKLIEGLQKVVR